MATRTLSRRALREQNDAAEAGADDEADEDDAPKTKVKKVRARKAVGTKEKKPAAPRARRKTVKVAERMFARWAVCDNGMKRVAVFEYKDRAAADVKLIQIRESKAGTFFLVLVKDPYEPPADPEAAPAAG